MIKVYCNGTRIQCLRQGELNVGMVGAPVEFDFSSEWDGLAKTAVFRCDGERDMIIGADGKTTVPHEILTTPGMDVEVGVYAKKEDGTTWPAPTTYCKIGRVGEGADPSGDESYPPTPGVGEQAIDAANKALQVAASAQEVAAEIQRRADSGEFDGAPGYTPVKGKDYFDGDDYVLTEADKVEIAEIAAGLVDVPESGGSADLTGYATEEWVEKGYQPKGDYATKDEIPPVPTKLSAFTNDAGFVTEDALKNVGGKAYVQDTEPAQMEVGEFWYNPEEEADSFPTTLPNPHKLTFSGAVNAEYDGSEAVEVVIPQGGGGGGKWEKIIDVTFGEGVSDAEITTDINGNPFALKEFVLWCKKAVANENSGYPYIYIRANGVALPNMNNKVSQNFSTYGLYLKLHADGTAHAIQADQSNRDNGDAQLYPIFGLAAYSPEGFVGTQYGESVKKFNLSSMGQMFAAGTRFIVYGVRA